MSYYVGLHPDLIYFGESAEADRWIEKNVEDAYRLPGAQVDLSIPPTEIHPGVLRYLRRTG